jgi:hypothetical protein
MADEVTCVAKVWQVFITDRAPQLSLLSLLPHVQHDHLIKDLRMSIPILILRHSPKAISSSSTSTFNTSSIIPLISYHATLFIIPRGRFDTLTQIGIDVKAISSILFALSNSARTMRSFPNIHGPFSMAFLFPDT